MKKRREKIKVSLIGFFLLLLPIAFITTGAIVVYYFVGKASWIKNTIIRKPN